MEKIYFPNIEAELGRTRTSQQSLADYIGVSRKTLSNWLNGKTEIPCSAIIKMCEFWNTSSDYLLGLDQNRAS